VPEKTYGNLMSLWSRLPSLSTRPREINMSIANTTPHYGTHPPHVLLRHFRPITDFTGTIPAPMPGRLMVVIGSENHGGRR
jgi:hypothetical protein